MVGSFVDRGGTWRKLSVEFWNVVYLLGVEFGRVG